MAYANREIDVLLTYPSDPMRLFDSMIPLGIASIASVLQEQGYSVQVIDFNHYSHDFRKDLRILNPKIIGIGGTTASRAGSFLTARLAKEIMPLVPIVYGGPHASFTVRDTLTHVLDIDYIIKGEGEYSFLSLCDFLIRRKPVALSTIGGLCYRSENDIIENKVRRIDNLDALPIPSRNLFSGPYNLTLDFSNVPAEFLITSRGCPACCSFCSASRMFMGGVRFRSMGHIKKEIDLLISTNHVRALKLFDSTFTGNREHALAFCEMIKPYDLIWECELRADSVDEYLLETMKSAGCAYINVGLESSVPIIQKTIAKNISTQQVEQCLSWCKKLGIKTKVFMIFGHIGQSFDQCKTDAAYINTHKNEIDFFATTIGLRIYPGTALETQAKRNMLMPANFSWAKYTPTILNYLIGEFGNSFVLTQRNLGFFKLFLVVTILARQNTFTSWSYIIKMVFTNTKIVSGKLAMSIVHCGHRIVRFWDTLPAHF